MSIFIVASIVFFVGIVIGLIAGRFDERRQWNLLIREGKLPIPSPAGGVNGH